MVQFYGFLIGVQYFVSREYDQDVSTNWLILTMMGSLVATFAFAWNRRDKKLSLPAKIISYSFYLAMPVATWLLGSYIVGDMDILGLYSTTD